MGNSGYAKMDINRQFIAEETPAANKYKNAQSH